MVWSQIDITKPHLVYIILGGFTSLFMLCSTVIKERMYIGEATVATLCGVIFGPHAANLIDPSSWGSVDIVTLEFSRIVLVVQCFAVGVELPKFYMEKHWRSVIFLLVPVMIAGWLLVSVVIWWMMPGLNWLEALVVSACVTATDPVLASSVVGKGKFAKRVPKHLRDLLSAESGCNDGMAFPFIYLSLYLIQYKRDAAEVSFHFIVYVVLYECVFGAVYGFLIGYIARHGIKYAEKHELIDRESFLVFYFVVALFCAGSGSILGVDDLLVGFAAGVGFSNDGWFGEKTEASHVSNVIDLLLNLTYFVYFGTIIPWEQYNSGYLGLNVWRLVVIAIFVIFFRRIPIMMALKPFIPDIKSWREALFAGHFGPIGVGAIFIAILARAELEHGEPVPLSELPPEGSPHYNLIYLVWPIVTFLVISSILVHGSSIAVFTLGKHINTLTLTMSYTAAPEDGPTWMNRLPRISSQSRSQARTMSEASFDDFKEPEFPAGTLAPPFNFLRRQKDNGHNRSGSRASSVGAKKRKSKKWDDGLGPGGPVSQSAIFPNRQSSSGLESPPNEKEPFPVLQEPVEATSSDESPGELEMRRAVNKLEEVRGRKGNEGSVPSKVEIYDEGDQLVFENQDGEVLDVQLRERKSDEELPLPNISRHSSRSEAEAFNWSLGGLRRKVTDMYSSELEKRKDKDRTTRRHEPARAYQFGNMIIVEDEDGEVVKTYELPSQKSSNQEGSDLIGSSLKYLGLGSLARQPEKEKTAEAATEEGNAPAAPAAEDSSKAPVKPSWVRRLSSAPQHPDQQQDDKQIRFTIGGVGRRMTKEDFINEVQNLDAKTRKEVVDHSTASSGLKRVARGDPPKRQQSQAVIPKIVEHESENNGSRSRSTERNRSNSSSVSPRRQAPPSSQRGRAGSSRGKGLEEPAETAVERKRRLAVLAAQAEDEDDAEGSGSGSGSGGPDVHETPAERRRREAALGVGGSADTYDSDSDDEGIPRVPPVRKGIRFAEDSRKSKK